ncbi:MAG: bifunctional methylenetetrahydrofolate dehydrogenase/methenyltetrahydrofolate cyclohydrolase FolD [Candidatus Melainabacteria bacterium]|nr:MAG: bifunctional methylenetetrahydrofolate dehydrogenase/methenyltetrahydrofolate cyclohydrolase FolD [Candidatus Melainabacteria bacterium]
MTVVIDGKGLSERIINNLKDNNISPTLAVILVGNNPASEIYVRNKEKSCEKAGIVSKLFKYDEDIQEKELLEKICQLNNDDSIDAILVQLPLPEHIDENKITKAILPEKDVDGFTPVNIGLLASGLKPYAYPCTPKGIMTILKEYNINPDGKHAVVVGRSNIVGKPLSIMLLNANATVTTCHSHTKNLKDITKTADILVVAVGKPKFITAEMVKEGAVVIDVGISRIDGKLCGDVDFESVSGKTAFITPVPKGVGPMTIASLMENTVELYKNRQKIRG